MYVYRHMYTRAPDVCPCRARSCFITRVREMEMTYIYMYIYTRMYPTKNVKIALWLATNGSIPEVLAGSESIFTEITGYMYSSLM